MNQHLALLPVVALSLALFASADAYSQKVDDPVAASVSVAPSIERGKIGSYANGFSGHETASGQRYEPDAMTMAHRTLPFGTMVKVTSQATQRSVLLRVNDRGPKQADRVADVSGAAARTLGMLKDGIVDAQLEVMESRQKSR